MSNSIVSSWVLQMGNATAYLTFTLFGYASEITKNKGMFNTFNPDITAVS